MGRGLPFQRPPFPGPMTPDAAIDESSRRPGSLNGQIFHKTRLCVKYVSQLPHTLLAPAFFATKGPGFLF